MDNLRFLDELFDDTPCRTQSFLPDEVEHDDDLAGPNTVGVPRSPHLRCCEDNRLACGHGVANQGDGATDDGGDDTLPDLPPPTEAFSAPSWQRATAKERTRSQQGGAQEDAAHKPGEATSSSAMLRATPVNVALQVKSSAPAKCSAALLPSPSESSGFLRTAKKPSQASRPPSRDPPPQYQHQQQQQEQQHQMAVRGDAAEESGALTWEERESLRSSVSALRQEVQLLESALARKESEEAAVATLLEENSAYMATLKEAVAEEQATRRAVEARCERIELAFSTSQQEMEEVQEELKRRLTDTVQRCTAAEASVKQGHAATLELQRLRAVMAVDSEARDQLRDRLARETQARQRAEAVAETAAERVRAMEQELSQQQRSHEASAAAYEQAQREGRATMEALQRQLSQAVRAEASHAERRVMAEGVLEALLQWVRVRGGSGQGGLAESEEDDSDQLLARALTSDSLQAALRAERGPTGATDGKPPQAEEREAEGTLSHGTLLQLSQMRERVTAATSQWRRQQFFLCRTQEEAIQQAVAAVAWLMETRMDGMSRSIDAADKRLARVKTRAEECAVLVRSGRAAVALAQEATDASVEACEALQRRHAQTQTDLEEAQRRFRLQTMELHTAQKRCAALQEQLRLQDVFASTTDALKDLRRLTAREIREAVSDLMDVTAGIGGDAASVVAVPLANGNAHVSRNKPFLAVVKSVVMKAEAHVELIRRTLEKSAGDHGGSPLMSFVESSAPTSIATRSSALLSSPATHRNGSPPPKAKAHLLLPAGQNADGQGPTWSTPGGNAAPREEGDTRGMTPRQQAIYKEMQRLIRRPPSLSPSAPATGAADRLRSDFHTMRCEDAGMRGTSASAALLSYPSEAQRRMLQIHEDLWEVAEHLVRQMQNLALLLENNVDQCEQHAASVVAAVTSWERRIAEGLEQCARAIEERVGLHYLQNFITPHLPLQSHGTVRETADEVMPPAPSASRAVRVDAAPLREDPQQTPPPSVMQRARSPRVPTDIPTPVGGLSPLLEKASLIREENALARTQPRDSTTPTMFSAAAKLLAGAAATGATSSSPSSVTPSAVQCSSDVSGDTHAHMADTVAPHRPSAEDVGHALPTLGRHHFTFRGSPPQQPLGLPHNKPEDEDSARAMPPSLAPALSCLDSLFPPAHVNLAAQRTWQSPPRAADSTCATPPANPSRPSGASGTALSLLDALSGSAGDPDAKHFLARLSRSESTTTRTDPRGEVVLTPRGAIRFGARDI